MNSVRLGERGRVERLCVGDSRLGVVGEVTSSSEYESRKGRGGECFVNSGTGPMATGMEESELATEGSSGSGRDSGRGSAPLSFLLSSSEGHCTFHVERRLNQH